MKVVAIISARMTSSRLPGKSLMKICGDPVLQHMLTRVKRAKLIDKIGIPKGVINIIFRKQNILMLVMNYSRIIIIMKK